MEENALIAAAERGDVDEVSELLDAGASIDATDVVSIMFNCLTLIYLFGFIFFIILARVDGQR